MKLIRLELLEPANFRRDTKDLAYTSRNFSALPS
jgi:hypothetical protein